MRASSWAPLKESQGTSLNHLAGCVEISFLSNTFFWSQDENLKIETLQMFIIYIVASFKQFGLKLQCAEDQLVSYERFNIHHPAYNLARKLFNFLIKGTRTVPPPQSKCNVF